MKSTVESGDLTRWRATAEEYFGTGSKKQGRGKAQASKELLAAAGAFLEEAHPTTVRGVCYRLFIEGVTDSMKRSETRKVSRLLTDAREEGMIPWEWIVDETREMERAPTWANPEAYVRAVRRSYRRDFWAEQPHRVEVWSEKGTVRGVLKPVLDEYGVGFLPLHGFNSATMVNDAAQTGDGRPLIVLYVGDYDPSGMFMSERDLPKRLSEYGGDHVVIRRVALLPDDLDDLPHFPAASKRKDPRYKWFRKHYGSRCWELDAMHPNALRDRVVESVEELIEWGAWERCEEAQEAEQASLEAVLDTWGAS